MVVRSYTLPYIMHFMHLCYAKEAWWKEFHHWEMKFQLPLLLPVVIRAAWGAALHTGGKSPPLQSWWADALGLFIFHVPFLCSKGMGGEMFGGGVSEQSTLCSDPFSFPVNSTFCAYVSESVNHWLCILSKPSATWWKILIIQIVSCLQYQCTFPDLAHFEHI